MKRNGFTLVEIISVISLLSILVIITTPAYTSISNSIRTRNYESKKSTIKSQTLSYVEKYMKDEIYTGLPKKDVNGNLVSDSEGNSIYEPNYYCFTVEYLIQNGIISSDSETEEYIKNDITGDEYETGIYVQVFYDNSDKRLKLVANTIDDKDIIKEENIIKCDVKL